MRALVASRLQLIPRFRKRVMAVPFGQGRPIWVDDEGFDIARHVRLTALPAPGTRRQLLELAERLMMQVLDRDRPLWELWFVEGVDHGEHVGLIHKSHHTLTDGISGVDIATVLLDFSAEPTVLDPTSGCRRPRPIRPGSCSTACGSGSRRPAELVGTARQLADAPREALGRAADLGRSIGSLVDAQVVAPRLSLNAPVGARSPPRDRAHPARRREDGARRVRRARSTTSCSPAVGSAVARLLDLRGRAPPELVVKVFCPVSVRDDDQRMQLGNRISAMLVPLRGRASPIRSCGSPRCARTTADLKEREQAVGAAALLGLVRVRGAHAARARRARRARAALRQPHRHQHPRPAGAALLPRRADARGVPDRRRCRGTSPSTSRSCRTAASCTSASSATAPPARDLEIARRRDRGRVRRAAAPLAERARRS